MIDKKLLEILACLVDVGAGNLYLEKFSHFFIYLIKIGYQQGRDFHIAPPTIPLFIIYSLFIF